MEVLMGLRVLERFVLQRCSSLRKHLFKTSNISVLLPKLHLILRPRIDYLHIEFLHLDSQLINLFCALPGDRLVPVLLLRYPPDPRLNLFIVDLQLPLSRVLLKLDKCLAHDQVLRAQLLNLLLALGDDVVVAYLTHPLVRELGATRVLSEGADHIVEVKVGVETSEGLSQGEEALARVEFEGVQKVVVVVLQGIVVV